MTGPPTPDVEIGSDGNRPDLDGEPIDEAVETVLAEDETRDREAVRTTLREAAEDGVVTRSALEETLAHLSKIVATPESRVEFAEMALADARETADHVSDLDIVRIRLDGYEARLGAIRDRVESLGEDLQDLVQRGDGAGIYETAKGARELRAAANQAQRDADELKTELESFERWVRDSDRRFNELEEDAGALESLLADLGAIADDLQGIEPDEADGDVPVVWIDATFRQRALALMTADLRAELAGLREWGEREGLRGKHDDTDRSFGDREVAIEETIDDLETRCYEIGERLEAVATPEWRERFADRLDELEAAIERFDPPVSWGDVQDVLEAHRTELGEDR